MAQGTLLVIEGNPGVLVVARNVLSKRGYTIVCAASPEDGLKKAERDLPSLIIVGVAFATPEYLNNLSLLIQVRVPIILSVPAGQAEATKAGLSPIDGVELVDVIETPFTPDTLADLVKETLLDYEQTRPIRIDSARYRAAVSPLPSVHALVEAVELESMPVVPCEPSLLVQAPAVDVRNDSSSGILTIEETIDAEAACELIDISILSISERGPAASVAQPAPEAETARAPTPSPSPSASQAVSGGFGVSARARRLATRLRRTTGDVKDLDLLCEEALRDEEIFGALASPLSDGEELVAGRLSAVGVPQIFQFVEGFDHPVCCRFEMDVEAIELVVSGRNLLFARQENLPEIFRIGRFLIELGVLAGRNLSHAVQQARDEGRRLGNFLHDEGIISRADVSRALERQAKELVFELLAWDDGRFAVTRCDPLPTEVKEVNLEMPLTGLLLDGFRRRDELRPPSNRVIAPS